MWRANLQRIRILKVVDAVGALRGQIVGLSEQYAARVLVQRPALFFQELGPHSPQRPQKYIFQWRNENCQIVSLSLSLF